MRNMLITVFTSYDLGVSHFNTALPSLQHGADWGLCYTPYDEMLLWRTIYHDGGQDEQVRTFIESQWLSVD